MDRWSAAMGSVFAACVLFAGGCGSDEDDAGSEGCEPACAADLVCVEGSCVADTPSCDPACTDGATCVDGTCVVPVTDEDGDGVSDEDDACPATAAEAVVDRSGCSIDQVPVPLPAGPYGSGIRDAAGDFTVETLSGPYSLHEEWTGADSHLFLLHLPTNAYSAAIWASDVAGLLADSPPGVHYFFLDASQDEAARRAGVEALQARFDAALAALDPAVAAHWEGRLHYVLDDYRALDGALGAFFAENPAVSFAIDRLGRWREVGILIDLTNNTEQMRLLASEARGFEYERRLAWEMGDLPAREVVAFDGDRHVGGWEAGYSTDVQITLPSAEEMKAFDSMAVYLYTACPDHLQGLEAGCNEWDYAHHLFVCDVDDPASCDTELVRYVTPYGREGEWLTDVSPLLPLFADGGTRTLRYSGANGYDMHLRILLWDAGKAHRPVELRFLWGASSPITWDAAYNDLFEPVTFVVDDPETTKVGIYNVVTGHGFGSTFQNCAEFCNSQHEFSVNGTLYREEHPEANIRTGCQDRIDEGVVPNQFGTWPFGRAGWCPGQDVKPWVQDVSDVLVSGENEISYRALYRDKPYDPVRTSEGTMPELRLQTWLVRYEAR